MVAPALIVLATLAAWRPVEVYPESGPLIGLGVLLLLPWAWRRRGTFRESWAVCLTVIAVASVSLIVGLDRQAGLSQLVLSATGLGLGWIAARKPTPTGPARVSAAIAVLAAWGLYQVVWGFSVTRSSLGVLPEPFRDTAAARLDTGRAYASLGLPGHLAVLLVMALPLLLDAARVGRWRWWARALIALDLAGLAATRSLAGAMLALGVVAAVNGRRLRWIVAVCVVVVVVGIVGARGDLDTLEPVVQRIDNGRTAIWAWTTAPVLGVGPGGLRQAGQRTPFPVRSVSAYAHCLPLQALAELGLLGLVLVSWGYAALLRLVQDTWRSDRPLAVAVAVVPLHNLVDFSMYVSGVLLPWSVLVGWLVARRRAAEVRPVGRRRWWLPVVGVAVVAIAGCLHAASRTVELDASDKGSLDRAVWAHRLAPWRVEPCMLGGSLALAEPTPSAVAVGRRLADHARRVRPRSGTVELMAARLAAVAGEPLTALERVQTARENRPRWAPAIELEQALLRAVENPR